MLPLENAIRLISEKMMMPCRAVMMVRRTCCKLWHLLRDENGRFKKRTGRVQGSGRDWDQTARLHVTGCPGALNCREVLRLHLKLGIYYFI